MDIDRRDFRDTKDFDLSRVALGGENLGWVFDLTLGSTQYFSLKWPLEMLNVGGLFLHLL